MVILLLVILFAGYVSRYSRADATALAAMISDEEVTVDENAFGWHFDGPADDAALIFYPGGRVEETAYAPFLRRLAQGGMDVYLVRMPLHLAVFDPDAAADILAVEGDRQWYVGGHSLGGAMAARYAAEHGEGLAGVILCAAFPTRPLDRDLTEVLVYGSEDGILRMDKVEESKQYAPAKDIRYEIPGGNHAQFGNYGPQAGDGRASISWEDQQTAAAEVILAAAGMEEQGAP